MWPLPPPPFSAHECQSPTGRDRPLSSQASCPAAAHWTLFVGDRQATSPLPIVATLVTIVTATARKLPCHLPPFHPASYQVPGSGLLSLSPTPHLPEATASSSLAWRTTSASLAPGLPCLFHPPHRSLGGICKCKSDHATPLVKALRWPPTGLSLALGLAWCGLLPAPGRGAHA